MNTSTKPGPKPNTDRPLEPRSLVLYRDQVQALDAIARATRRSRSSVAQEAVDVYLRARNMGFIVTDVSVPISLEVAS